MQRGKQAGATRQFLINRLGKHRMGDDTQGPWWAGLLDMAHGSAAPLLKLT
jgi:hypothetical protein